MSGGSLDRFDTPRQIAEDLYEAIVERKEGPGYVLDPAMGGGALLRPFEEAGAGWIVSGIDIDQSSVEAARRQFSSWEVRAGDFLARAGGHLADDLGARSFDAVVVNPPFSYRGASASTAEYAGRSIRCSPTGAFMLRSAEVSSVNGVVAALVPASFLRSDRDRLVRSLLSSDAHFEVLRTYHRNAFPGVHASTALVRLDRTNGTRRAADEIAARPPTNRPIVRGWVQMHSRTYRRGPWRDLVHTTDLSANLRLNSLRRVRSQRVLAGPAVLLPRVGSLSSNQITTLSIGREVALSDCVFGIRCTDVADSQMLRAGIISGLTDLRALTAASCAPYLTKTDLSDFLWLQESVDRVPQRL